MDSATEIRFISGLEAGGPRLGASRAAVPGASLPGWQMGSSHVSAQSGTLPGVSFYGQITFPKETSHMGLVPIHVTSLNTPMDTLSLTKEAKLYNGEDNLFNKWCWENWSTMCKRLKLEHYMTTFQKVLN